MQRWRLPLQARDLYRSRSTLQCRPVMALSFARTQSNVSPLRPFQSRHSSTTQATTSIDQQETALTNIYTQYFKHDSENYATIDELASFQGKVHVTGFISKLKRGLPEKARFEVLTPQGKTIRVVSKSPEFIKQVQAISPFSPVHIVGEVQVLSGQDESPKPTPQSSEWRLHPESIRPLNHFPRDIIISKSVVFPPTARHLQMRFHQDVLKRLEFRSYVKRHLFESACDMGYLDIETPLLFKSTSEGAREFLVPTRRPGLAYALPQSPQQYKQVLMAAGIPRYMQFARCFRDEDLRADRQPEFTQLDLERSFADGEDVMRDVESLVTTFFDKMKSDHRFVKANGSWLPIKHSASVPEIVDKTDSGTINEINVQSLPAPFPRLKYQDCIAKYGVDKPDLRIPLPIFRFPDNAPIQEFLSKTTHLETPIMEAWRMPLLGNISPKEAKDFVRRFMSQLKLKDFDHTQGLPQVLVYDSSLPLNGLSSLGFEGCSILDNDTSDAAMNKLEDGDIVLFQARDPTQPAGGATKLGDLRSKLWNELLTAGIYSLSDKELAFRFLWVTDFPMFTPNSGTDPANPGQGGTAGYSATHHPFTSPKTPQDFKLLFSDNPSAAVADHYDLVVNGVELGGGSRRIHVAEIQEFVMRDVLRMDQARIAEFSHLFQALRAGCPPHAGFALGFDRLCAVLAGTGSIRDVTAFPKSMKGEDLFAQAPGPVTAERLGEYHLQAISKKRS